jgi:hypothetical protein
LKVLAVYISSAVQRFAEWLRWDLDAESFFSMEQKNPHGFKLVSSRSTTNVQDVEVPTNFSSRWSLPLLSTGSDCDPLKPRQKIGLQLDYILPLRCSAGSNWLLVLEFHQIRCQGAEDRSEFQTLPTFGFLPVKAEFSSA